MNLGSLTKLLARSEKLVIDNSPAILTAIGVVGTVTTAVLTGKASIKAHDQIAAEIHIRDKNLVAEQTYAENLTGKEKFELTWKLYIPPVGAGLLTVAAIISANRIGTRRAAGIAAAYALSEKGYSEYRDKVIEKLGADKEKALRDDIAQDRVSRTPGSREVVVVGTDVLCLDAYSGRYFTSNMQDLLSAQNEINTQVINNMYASLSDLYHILGIAKTSSSDEVGWNVENQLKFEFSTALAEDGRPCLSVSYDLDSTRDYWRNH